MNTVKTVLLMGLLTGLFVFVGHLVGGQNGMIVALAFAAVLNVASYWFSDKIVLTMYHAQPVEEASAPRLYAILHRLAGRANIPTPRLYMIPGQTPNAFATGRDPQHAVVALTEGIVRILKEDELEAVIAHELSHVRHRDILISAIAATLAGALMIMARILGYSLLFFGGSGRDRNGGGLGALFAIIFAPIAALLIQMAISRSREYSADQGAAELTGHPLSLAHALAKLQQGNEYVRMDAQPSTAHMFIVNPLSGKSLMSLFSTHPPIEQRIERLEKMARETGRM